MLKYDIFIAISIYKIQFQKLLKEKKKYHID